MSLLRHVCLSLSILATGTVWAQAAGTSLRMTDSLASLTKRPSGPVTADFIVAIVNSEPITDHEVQSEMRRQLQQLQLQGRPQPDLKEMRRQVLDRLINERVQLQLARETGIRIEDAAVDQAELNVARQNQIDVSELRRRLGAEGVAVKQFREQLRDQLTVMRLREREIESRARISDLDVERYLRDQSSGVDPARVELELAQILVAVPDGASTAQTEALQAKAQKYLERARAGEEFAALAREASDGPERNNGGNMGLRTASRYPQLFLQAVDGVPNGGLSAVVRSGAGFHVLKVLERKLPGLPATTVQQTHARHILLRPGPGLSDAQARERLADWRRRILAKQADFAELARQNSQDGSAADGGDLGWANAGLFVPEFEEALAQLQPGHIGEPLQTRYGWHLVQLLERRTVALSEREQREAVRAMLREKKLDEVYASWAQEQRGRAYIELRDPPAQ